MIEDVEFLVGGRLQVLHAGGDGDSAGAAGAIEAAGFHFDAGFFASLKQKGAGGNFGGLAAGKERDFGHRGASEEGMGDAKQEDSL